MSTKRPLLSPESAGDEDAFAPRQAGNNPGPVPTDTAWAVAFKVNLAITLLSALYFGSSGIRALNAGLLFPGDDDQRRLSGTSTSGGIFAPLLFFVGVVAAGWAFAGAVLHLIITFSREILQVAYLGFTGISGVAAVTALSTGHWLAWIFPAFLCAWSLRFFVKRRSRIRFSSANLKVAALAVRSMPWTIRAALLMSGVQVLWLFLSLLAMWGSIASLQTVTAPGGTVYPASDCRDVASPHSCQCRGEVVSYNSYCRFEGRGGGFWVACFFLASLAWGSTVLQNVVAATINGSVASWWFCPEDRSPVRGALYRATRESFGSLCKAAAVSTVMQLFILAVRRLSKVGRWGAYLLEGLRDAVDYVLSYAVCFIGIYGLSFSEAGRRVSELFKRRGVTTIANDGVADVGLSALVVGLTVCYMSAAYLLLLLVGGLFGMGELDYGVVFLILVLGYVLVAMIMATTLQVLRSAFRAVFVCFVQDESALAKNHDRQIYDDLSRAWREMEVECPEMMARNASAGHHGIQDV